MIFLFKDDRISGERKSGRVVAFGELKKLVEGLLEGTLIGRYKEGRIDDKGRVVEDSYLEIFYVERKRNGVEERHERMYKIRKESVWQKREIGKWIREGRIGEGHVNVEKYKHNQKNPIIDI